MKLISYFQNSLISHSSQTLLYRPLLSLIVSLTTTKLVSVRFHFVDKYLCSLIIIPLKFPKAFCRVPDWILEWFTSRTRDVRHISILFSLSLHSIVFLSFVVRFRLVILFYSYFCICWLDFFPNIRFFNRSDLILRIKLSLSLRVIWSFLVVRIACFTWKTFLCLNCCFTSFSSLKPYINGPQINTMHQVFIFLDCRGQI